MRGPLIGACDVCDAQDVELSRCMVTGIETFACEECTECADEEERSENRQFGAGA